MDKSQCPGAQKFRQPEATPQEIIYTRFRLVIDIYKKLPGTNCGKCGVPNCMVFALKVKNNQLNITCLLTKKA
jgi:ArsR family metal-binding transcriptional regulator